MPRSRSPRALAGLYADFVMPAPGAPRFRLYVLGEIERFGGKAGPFLGAPTADDASSVSLVLSMRAGHRPIWDTGAAAPFHFPRKEKS